MENGEINCPSQDWERENTTHSSCHQRQALIAMEQTGKLLST